MTTTNLICSISNLNSFWPLTCYNTTDMIGAIEPTDAVAIAGTSAVTSTCRSTWPEIDWWTPTFGCRGLLNDYTYDGEDNNLWRYNIGSNYYYTPTYGDGDSTYYYTPVDTTPIAQKRREIKEQLTIIVTSRAQELRDIPANEWAAMQTLREMITETEYRKYIRDGFISVRGQSGKVYQIFRNRWHTKVYFRGELVEEICVRLKGSAPPTDNVIAFKTMIEFDEEYFASLGNRYNMRQAA